MAIFFEHGVQKRRQGSQAVRIEVIADAGPLELALDDTGRPENTQMLRHRRLGQPNILHDVATDAGLLREKQSNDMDASRMTQRFGDGCDFLVAG